MAARAHGSLKTVEAMNGPPGSQMTGSCAREELVARLGSSSLIGTWELRGGLAGVVWGSTCR